MKNLIKEFEQADMETLKTLKMLVFIALVADMVGLYWYLGVKKLSLALLVVCIVALTIIYALESRKMEKGGNKMTEEEKTEEKSEEKEEKKDKKEKKDDDEDDRDDSMNFGLPDAEDFQKRAERAIGM